MHPALCRRLAARVVKDDHDTARGEREVFHDEFSGEREKRKPWVKHNLRRGEKHAEGAEQMQNENRVSRLGKHVWDERETYRRLKASKQEVPDAVGKKRKTRMDDIIDGINTRKLKRAKPEKDDTDRYAKKRDASLK